MYSFTCGCGGDLEVVSIEFDPQGFHYLILRCPLLVCTALPWLECDYRPLDRLFLSTLLSLNFRGLGQYASASLPHGPYQVVDVLRLDLHHG